MGPVAGLGRLSIDMVIIFTKAINTAEDSNVRSEPEALTGVLFSEERMNGALTAEHERFLVQARSGQRQDSTKHNVHCSFTLSNAMLLW